MLSVALWPESSRHPSIQGKCVSPECNGEEYYCVPTSKNLPKRLSINDTERNRRRRQFNVIPHPPVSGGRWWDTNRLFCIFSCPSVPSVLSLLLFLCCCYLIIMITSSIISRWSIALHTSGHTRRRWRRDYYILYPHQLPPLSKEWPKKTVVWIKEWTRTTREEKSSNDRRWCRSAWEVNIILFWCPLMKRSIK